MICKQNLRASRSGGRDRSRGSIALENLNCLYKRFIFNFHYLSMKGNPIEQVKLVTNFIIIPAPNCKATVETLSPPITKREESPLSDEQRPSSNIIEKPMTPYLGCRKKYPKDDYQKNITINVVKCCIREILSHKFRKLIGKKCREAGVSQDALNQMVAPVLKEVVISLGDLKKMLTSPHRGHDVKLKRVFAWFLEWYLRKRYMHYLLVEGKMDHKERYVDYKNKYMLFLLQTKDLEPQGVNPNTLDNQSSHQ